MNVLKDKVVLITGASKGIGAATAKAMAEDGARVVVNYNGSTEAAASVVASIKEAGGMAIAIKADVGNEKEVIQLFDDAIAAFGKVDVLVNNAGMMFTRAIGEVSAGDFDAIFNTNVKGVFHTLKQAAARLADNGSVINLSSTVTRTTFPGYGAYCATKGAVEQLTRIFAKEVGARGINVNAVLPGPTDTDLFMAGKSPEQIKMSAASAALGRLGNPSDIAKVIVFLASDEAKWISGQNIGVNGGMA